MCSGKQFRSEIEFCGVCEVALLAGAEMQERENQRQAVRQDRSGEFTGGEELVVIQRGPLGDLRRLEELLGRERIPVRIEADEASCGKGCGAASFLLQVSRDDAAEAAKIVTAEHRRQTALDDHQEVAADAVFNPEAEETTCPACGHRFPPTSSQCPDCGLNFG
ncbi:MAG: hypothetical protein U5J62_02380 [Desulfurivibrio sp.]|nr:hypothetical protein [Desulfurivibrio sp.]